MDTTAFISEVRTAVGEERFAQVAGLLQQGRLTLTELAGMPAAELTTLGNAAKQMIVRKQYRDALATLEALLVLHPLDDELWLSYGILWHQLREHARARLAYAVASWLAPQTMKPYVYVAECELVLRRPAAALHVVAPAFHLEGQSAEGAELLRRGQRVKAIAAEATGATPATGAPKAAGKPPLQPADTPHHSPDDKPGPSAAPDDEVAPAKLSPDTLEKAGGTKDGASYGAPIIQGSVNVQGSTLQSGVTTLQGLHAGLKDHAKALAAATTGDAAELLAALAIRQMVEYDTGDAAGLQDCLDDLLATETHRGDQRAEQQVAVAEADPATQTMFPGVPGSQAAATCAEASSALGYSDNQLGAVTTALARCTTVGDALRVVLLLILAAPQSPTARELTPAEPRPALSAAAMTSPIPENGLAPALTGHLAVSAGALLPAGLASFSRYQAGAK